MRTTPTLAREWRPRGGLGLPALAGMLGLCFAVGSGLTQPPADFSKEIPRLNALSTEQAVKAIQVKPGVRVELMAAEPLVASPVAMEWDETGALFVCEMRGYSEHRDEKLSRVRRLVDTDGDGKPDKATVYAEGLLWPTAVFPWDGGIFVADAPDILYFKDTNGDGIADKKERVYTGLGSSNVQGLINSFRWHPEGRIHAAASSNGGELRRVDGKGPTLSLRGRDFSFDPKTLDLRAETGGAQHGMCFDDWGRKYLCHNSDHVIYAWADDADIVRNPSFAAPSAKASIAEDGPQAEVFRISPVEPWRIVRTRLRVQGQAKGPIEGGGRAAGYFTSATGVTIVRGDLVPGELQGMLLVGDVGSNLIHRKKIDWEGAHPIARRVDSQSEFIASTDTWFRPAQFANGPDGAAWFLDVCREVIEHPASIPPDIKKLVDLDSGRDRGRLYRILADKAVAHKIPDWSQAKTAELVESLGHANAWHRETASRLLFTRNESLDTALEKAVSQTTNPRLRVMALWLLAAKNTLSIGPILSALEDPHPRVREIAVRLGRRYPEHTVLGKQLEALTDDPDAGVRLALAFALGSRKTTDVASFAKLLARDGSDPWMQAACQSAPGLDRIALARAIFGQPQAKISPSITPLLGSLLCDWSLAKDGAAQAGEAFAQLSDALAPAVLAAFARQWAERGRTLDSWKTVCGEAGSRRLAALLAKASADFDNERLGASERATALRLVAIAEGVRARARLEQSLTAREAPEVRSAALEALVRLQGGETARVLIKAWPALPPADRAAAADFLVGRAVSANALLDAAGSGQFPLSELDPVRRGLLARHNDPKVRARALPLLERSSAPARAEVIAKYRGVLALKGDAGRGTAIHAKVCASCHKVGQVGTEIGPSLAAAANRGAESLLLNILDPNREANPQFLAYVVSTRDGRVITGMIASETPAAVTLIKQGGEKETLLRSAIEEVKSTGKSLMPEGLEQQVDAQGMADLIAFLLKP